MGTQNQALTENQPTPGSQHCSRVVAAVLTRQNRICLFQSSNLVSGDAGLWHCITGYLPHGVDPDTQVLTEIEEESGINCSELTLRKRAVIELMASNQHRWEIHAFHFDSSTESIMLNWEHTAYSWVEPKTLSGHATVHWLDDILQILSVQIDDPITCARSTLKN
ncbi:MAG: NUDIX domain-containing protein [Spongiibacteraceae bacterium]